MLLIIGLIFIIGCSNSDVKYANSDDLMKYLFDVHGLDTDKEILLYITPVDGCSYCVIQNLSMLSRLKNNKEYLIPVLIDYSFNEEVLELKEKLSKKYNLIFEDNKSMIYQYKTGFSKPLLIHLKNKEVVKFLFVEDDLIMEAESYIENVKI